MGMGLSLTMLSSHSLDSLEDLVVDGHQEDKDYQVVGAHHQSVGGYQHAHVKHVLCSRLVYTYMRQEIRILNLSTELAVWWEIVLRMARETYPIHRSCIVTMLHRKLYYIL